MKSSDNLPCTSLPGSAERSASATSSQESSQSSNAEEKNSPNKSATSATSQTDAVQVNVSETKEESENAAQDQEEKSKGLANNFFSSLSASPFSSSSLSSSSSSPASSSFSSQRPSPPSSSSSPQIAPTASSSSPLSSSSCSSTGGDGASCRHRETSSFHSNLSSSSSSSSASPCFQYCLVALIEHEGHAIDQGHYICYVKHLKTGRWFKADDKVVTYVDFETQVLTAAPYMLFYERIYTPDETEQPRMRGDSQDAYQPSHRNAESSQSPHEAGVVVEERREEKMKTTNEEEEQAERRLYDIDNSQGKEQDLHGRSGGVGGEEREGIAKEDAPKKETHDGMPKDEVEMDVKGWWRRERASRQWDWSSWSEQVKRIPSLSATDFTAGKHEDRPLSMYVCMYNGI